MLSDETINYFETKAKEWIDTAYDKKDGHYPVGFHRLRITNKIIDEYYKGKKISLLDIGCGGGNLCLEMAKRGFSVVGIDRSREMISIAKKTIGRSDNIKLFRCDFTDVPLADSSFDVVTAHGVIGYLDDIDSLFVVANRVLKKGGLFIVSCRNRLFNMFPISKYIDEEITSDDGLKLIAEIKEIYREYNIDIPVDVDLEVKPSQQTPSQMKELGLKHGFSLLGFKGAHPHFFLDSISNFLLTFEDLHLSLIWSSVFIGVFRK